MAPVFARLAVLAAATRPWIGPPPQASLPGAGHGPLALAALLCLHEPAFGPEWPPIGGRFCDAVPSNHYIAIVWQAHAKFGKLRRGSHGFAETGPASDDRREGAHATWCCVCSAFTGRRHWSFGPWMDLLDRAAKSVQPFLPALPARSVPLLSDERQGQPSAACVPTTTDCGPSSAGCEIRSSMTKVR